MSIGPKVKDAGTEISVANKLQYSAKQLTSTFFSDPLYYIFYGSLSGLVVGLLSNTKFSYQLYTVVILLGVINLFKFLIKQTDSE